MKNKKWKGLLMMESRSLTEKLKGLIVLPNWIVVWLITLQNRILSKWSGSERLKRVASWVNKKGEDRLGGKVTAEQLLYLPNMMCYLRVLIIPLYLFGWVIGANKWFYLFTYLILMALDLFDGPVARQTNTTSPLGKAIDPFGDKTCHMSMAFVAVMFGFAPWWLFVALLVKEVLLMTTSSHYKKTGAKIYGKVGTVVEVVVLSLAFIFPLPIWVFIALAFIHWVIYFAYRVTDKQ